MRVGRDGDSHFSGSGVSNVSSSNFVNGFITSLSDLDCANSLILGCGDMGWKFFWDFVLLIDPLLECDPDPSLTSWSCLILYI